MFFKSSRREFVTVSLIGISTLPTLLAACSPAQAPAPTTKAPEKATTAPTPSPAAKAAPTTAAVAKPKEPAFKGATVEVHMPPLIHAAPVLLANDLGFFKDEGLDVHLEVANSQIDTLVQMLAGGKLDWFTGNTDASLNNALTRGAPIKAIAVGEVGKKGYRYTGMLISDKLWQQGVREPKDLRVKQINVEMHVAMGVKNTAGRKYYKFMKYHGFEDPMKAFEIKEWTNPGPIIQSFLGGQMDVLFTAEPRLAILQEQANAHVIGWDNDVPEMQGEPGLLMTLHEGWLKEDPERGVRLTKGYLKGIQVYLEQVENGWKDQKLRKIVAERTSTQEKLFDKIGGPFFPPNGQADLARIDEAISFFKTTIPVITGDLTPASKFVDFSYVKEAASRLGIKS